VSDHQAERWLRQIFTSLTGRTVTCTICGAIVAYGFREIHARFHGRKDPG
jgi:hypothetical protein